MFSQVIKELRKQNKYTHQYVADQLGITRQAYSNYEKGRVPDTSIVIKLAELYSVSTDYILGRSNDLEIDRMLKDLKVLPELERSVIIGMITSYIKSIK
ncbi:helix-turn-helix transcriptional regulator (plasmid) [Brevibacillus halotolerans]|nr:helix-turn-helix transcriptional regulator [Brevibacillus halotolerans]